jgi:hypothetical protein
VVASNLLDHRSKFAHEGREDVFVGCVWSAIRALVSAIGFHRRCARAKAIRTDGTPVHSESTDGDVLPRNSSARETRL